MRLTASIVTHDTPPQQLRKALTCLLRSPAERIFIIDNSDLPSPEPVALMSDRIEFRHVENRGFGAGHNVAIREAVKERDGAHIVMNADVWWDGDVAGKMLSFMEAHQEVGMMAPGVSYPDGSLQYSCRMLPSPLDLAASRFLPRIIADRRLNRYYLKSHDHSLPLNCPYLFGCFLMLRNAALIECGGFDERFFMYPEDIDITRRIHRRWTTLYWPEAQIVHEHARASRRSLRMLGIHMANMVRYFNKWGWIRDPEREEFNNRLLGCRGEKSCQ